MAAHGSVRDLLLIAAPQTRFNGHHRGGDTVQRGGKPPNRAGKHTACLSSTAQRHLAAVHQGCERAILETDTTPHPPLPDTSWKQYERKTMIKGSIEIVSLIPSGNATLQGPPWRISCGGEEPNQGNTSQKPAKMAQRISSRRRSSCSRFRRCLASLSISRPSWR